MFSATTEQKERSIDLTSRINQLKEQLEIVKGNLVYIENDITKRQKILEWGRQQLDLLCQDDDLKLSVGLTYKPKDFKLEDVVIDYDLQKGLRKRIPEQYKQFTSIQETLRDLKKSIPRSQDIRNTLIEKIKKIKVNLAEAQVAKEQADREQLADMIVHKINQSQLRMFPPSSSKSSKSDTEKLANAVAQKLLASPINISPDPDTETFSRKRKISEPQTDSPIHASKSSTEQDEKKHDNENVSQKYFSF